MLLFLNLLEKCLRKKNIKIATAAKRKTTTGLSWCCILTIPS
ncbi:hypothetical protein FSS13T_09550 [Flavobacterium saliperosum S13]|uniref:Uncharacterized protein n=1 Tax=Flavobacterium saliperosum S13 TaxID=1341155 RepID=A0ABN0QI20_9FLAO|nr:hypothetical protein FSS13T_09550 [Flavobacterium saliperosum S13]